MTQSETPTRKPANRIVVWLLAARPESLVVTAGAVLIGTAMAWRDGAFHGWSALSALFGAVFIQVGTNYWNDYADYRKGADTAISMTAPRPLVSGQVSPQGVKRAAYIAFSLAALISIYLVWRGGWPLAVIMVLAIAFGFLYTSGPYPIAYVGLGEVFVLVCFGPVAVGGTYFVQAQTLHPAVLVSGLAPGLIACGILVVNNLRDILPDAEAGKRTLAVRFGAKFAKAEYAFCLTGAALIPVALHALQPTLPALALPLVILVAVAPGLRIIYTGQEGWALNEALGYTARTLLLYSVLFAVIWNLGRIWNG